MFTTRPVIRRRHIESTVPFAVRCAAVVLAVFFAGDAEGQQSDQVDVDGRRVEIVAMGMGEPTIVLESAAGSGLSIWRSVMPALAQQSRVIAYSRRGFGGSEPGGYRRTSEQDVDDLRRLLDVVGEDEPVVIVGHSWGGLLARLFLSSYPDRVAGLVLVDATHEQQWSRWEQLEPGYSFSAEVRAMLPELSPALRSEYESVLAVAESGQVPGMKPIPDMPLAVITALKPCRPDQEWICRDPRALQVWRGAHAEWAERSTSSVHFVSARTGHYVMRDQPELIIDAVEFVLKEIRSQR